MVLLASSISAVTPLSSPESEDRVYFRWRYKVHILNGMPDNVTRVIISCHSNEDDLGAYTPFQGEEFKFEFITNFIKKTHFTCTFWWGVLYAKDVSVFDDVEETETGRRKLRPFVRIVQDQIGKVNAFDHFLDTTLKSQNPPHSSWFMGLTYTFPAEKSPPLGNFAAENLLGKGGFGSVYEARFNNDDNGTSTKNLTLAVKVLDLQQTKAVQGFLAESMDRNQVFETFDPRLLKNHGSSVQSSFTTSTSSGDSSDGISIGTDDDHIGRKYEECLAAVIRVGLCCAAQSAKDRLSMRETMTKLHDIKKYLLS
ncbi:hypothetical protein V6N11_010184 [Hibiscus sabdariffa]|uniref:Protein kinase domain-containing protein n=1 Tax=Hibiscus sabdariffa TaxID=183260 RepID=A0ABR2PDV2_9ROSI